MPALVDFLKEAPAAFDRPKLLEGLGTTEEATVKSAGIVEEVHAPLAEYAKTTISADHIEENPALKKLENPLEGVSNDQVTHADVKLFVEAVVRPIPLLQKQTLKDLKLPKNLKKFMKFMKALSILIDTQADMVTLSKSHRLDSKTMVVFPYTTTLLSYPHRKVKIICWPTNGKQMILSSSTQAMLNSETRHLLKSRKSVRCTRL